MNSHCLLVVEDDPRIADLVCHLATDAGFQAHAATGPQAIIKAHDNIRPDVIVLDIMMPEMDGIEVLQFLRQQFSRSRIVIISGSDSTFRRMAESLAKGLGIAIEANMSKPLQLDEFRTLLEKIKLSLDDEQKLCPQNHGHCQ